MPKPSLFQRLKAMLLRAPLSNSGEEGDSGLSYPPKAEPGDSILYVKGHAAKCDGEKLRWEGRVGGAVGKCSVCGEWVEVVVLVLGDTVPVEQWVWITQILEEPFDHA